MASWRVQGEGLLDDVAQLPQIPHTGGQGDRFGAAFPAACRKASLS
jgi:hypothetical protein